jgi:excisionase family DNA binding protein
MESEVGAGVANVAKIAPLLTVQEVAQTLSLSESATRRLIASGELKTVRIGKAIRMTVKQLNDYINNSVEN